MRNEGFWAFGRKVSGPKRTLLDCKLCLGEERALCGGVWTKGFSFGIKWEILFAVQKILIIIPSFVCLVWFGLEMVWCGFRVNLLGRNHVSLLTFDCNLKSVWGQVMTLLADVSQRRINLSIYFELKESLHNFLFIFSW